MNNPFNDFILDKAKQTATINREFDAELSLVWDAFTKQEILDQWWAPKPWSSRTKHMNFEEGGKRFYAMVSPEGQEHWSLQQYLEIKPITFFKMLNSFADADENPQLPGSEWSLHFSEVDGKTRLSVVIWNESLERMEKMIEMGFKEGFTMTLKSLEGLLAELSKK